MRIGIIGGSGYVGGELLRLLLLHPSVEVTMVTSRQSVGEYVFNIHPNLRGLTQLKFVPQDIEMLQKNCDLVFTATPHGGSVNLVPKLLEGGLKVIDMSADFRIKNPNAYETYYGWKHENQELLKEAVYGLPELHREEIKHAKLVACPGCMATSAILGLAPIVKAGLVDTDKIIVDLKVGSSGGGSKPTSASHHPERFSGVRPYQVTGHRHIAEVEQELSILSSQSVKIGFTPHAVNMIRGILATIHTYPKQALTSKDLWKALRGMYDNEPFIRLVKYQKGQFQLPDPKITLGTNFCDIGFEIDEHTNRLVMFSAIDNMCKGASGQGVQCLNLLMGIDETTGLKSTGFHPM
ncbi:MAG: N-acetyl-gamma-glutamyl-phosphate reductase [Nitrososphaerota archaeon]|uniref:N-acetyl-gamma-glutamyl-phosphate reductase n=1 Tax=Candidatus Bathycorpusculum sp. TaxID=2994959 RepID=UPI00283150FE|nr:N-acetyl-gamma-glutamyl-phosphate reductase [Candidatus Termiticorpusculum sp.]MCL2256760.1 N-acetyl-gamma-glutamyl-phosphate reductase [Candidatus Termiticorpusculum sp.]MCL2293045.1 N-acetyl-gamma-glutamyl-phosphate reductase [Candidatus Termiticorpusculum sp.]MDR0460008.1 N-acetyl-gamma-glutamyl-phosphate reductase [Nitrososphaerota archaeon]